MEHAKWERPIRGGVLGVFFCLAYLAGWFNSLDQWYLPAGIRVAAFLLLPYRYWPYLLAGDCAGMLFLRVPRIPTDSATWAYGSSFLIPLTTPLAIISIRRKLKTAQDQAKWIPLVAAFLAIFGSLCNAAINDLLGGPPSGTTLEFFYVRCVGQFLAILSVTLPAILWIDRKSLSPRPAHFLRDILFSIVAISAIFFSIVWPAKISEHLRIGLTLLMLIPVIFLTFRHGWQGAAIGISASCFAVAKTLFMLNYEGAYDAPVFIVQHALVIASCGLLALGHAISSQYATARSLGISEKEALQAARTGFLASERMLREKALSLEQMQRFIDEERKRVVDHLKAIGDLQGALLLNSEAVAYNSRFGTHITDIYPLRLEQHGLNAVLNSQEFVDARGGNAHLLPLLGSNPRQLSLELQQSAYRCACNAIDVLSESQPQATVIKTRIRKSKSYRGILIVVTVRNPGEKASTSKSANAAIELNARVKAHGGAPAAAHRRRSGRRGSGPRAGRRPPRRAHG